MCGVCREERGKGSNGRRDDDAPTSSLAGLFLFLYVFFTDLCVCVSLFLSSLEVPKASKATTKTKSYWGQWQRQGRPCPIDHLTDSTPPHASRRLVPALDVLPARAAGRGVHLAIAEEEGLLGEVRAEEEAGRRLEPHRLAEGQRRWLWDGWWVVYVGIG